MKNMSDEDWDLVTLVHLKGAFACTKACWPLFRQQKVSFSAGSKR
jgi:multifunctional beta-oxidation protein